MRNGFPGAVLYFDPPWTHERISEQGKLFLNQ
jgi:metal-sulfur cluster biosynthetic enzyme